MGSQKDNLSDAEDIPSDFFDDFNKDDFIEGLSVIDSWDVDAGGGKRRTSRINAEAVGSVKDLRELIRDVKEDTSGKWDRRSHQESPLQGPSVGRRSGSRNLDDYIKPGSRRDPSKTNEAIKRDKEVKVKEYLAKHLESSDDLKPPGTELDDFFEKPAEVKKAESIVKESYQRQSSERHQRESPVKQRRRSPKRSPRRSPRHSPRRSPRHSPRRSPRHSPRRSPRASIRRSPRRSPYRSFRQSPRRASPLRRTNRNRSPILYHKSPKFSPKHIPRWERHSRSPYRRMHRRSFSRSPVRKDSFLYPREDEPMPGYGAAVPYQVPGHYAAPVSIDYPASASVYSYPQGVGYDGGYSGPYDYGAQIHPPVAGLGPQPVPAPVLNTTPPIHSNMPLPIINPNPASIPLPVMVPAPQQMVSPVPSGTAQSMNTSTPYDALAQLVADGKLSQEDYLKLAPNKGKTGRLHGANLSVDTKTRVEALNRCNAALSQLGSLTVPNRLMMNINIGPEPKYLAPKFCSPLKRQPCVEFNYTDQSTLASVLHNKQLVDSIIHAVGLNKVIARPKRKALKNMKDAAVQTSKPYCDVCDIRESTKFYETATSIDPEHFSASVHTQVVEHDLVNSKSVFNPSGSIADGAPISIAHLTPAQLVSQLAARAKTLKQSSDTPQSPQFGRRPPNYDYDYDGRGGQQQYQNNYNNYRY